MAYKGMSSTGRRGMGTGSKTNHCARHPRSAKRKAVKSRTKNGSPASGSRPMEWKYRNPPFGGHANIRGL